MSNSEEEQHTQSSEQKNEENQDQRIKDENTSNDKAEEIEQEKSMEKNNRKQTREERFIQRCKDASIVRKIVAITITVLTILMVFGAVRIYNYVQSGLSPVDPDDQSVVEVEIPMGSSSRSIAEILEEEGVINDALFYRLYVNINNVGSFQAGNFELTPAMTLEEITEILQSGTVPPLFRVTIPEGRTIEEIAILYENGTNIDADEFLDLMRDEEYIEGLIDEFPNILSEEILNEDIRYALEGYLFPATYPFYEENPSIDQIIRDMLRRTDQVISSHFGEIAQLEQFSVHEILTFASIVEREARDEEERMKIAGVFYNRLEEGMRLETDPTVLYALGEHRERVMFSDLEVESPYNTYRVHGLPVGPISNFGESSLRAVLDPTDTNYLFFVAAPDGEIYFSETFEEHRDLANEHLDRDL